MKTVSRDLLAIFVSHKTTDEDVARRLVATVGTDAEYPHPGIEITVENFVALERAFYNPHQNEAVNWESVAFHALPYEVASSWFDDEPPFRDAPARITWVKNLARQCLQYPDYPDGKIPTVAPDQNDLSARAGLRHSNYRTALRVAAANERIRRRTTPRVPTLRDKIEITVSESLAQHRSALRLSASGQTVVFRDLHYTNGTPVDDPQLAATPAAAEQQLRAAGIDLIEKNSPAGHQIRQALFGPRRRSHGKPLTPRQIETLKKLVAGCADLDELNDEIKFGNLSLLDDPQRPVNFSRRDRTDDGTAEATAWQPPAVDISSLDWSDLPAALKAWRTALGLTQTQAAERLTVSLRTYQAWEQGRYTPEQPGLVRIACLAVAGTNQRLAATGPR